MSRVSFRWRLPRQRWHWLLAVAGLLITARVAGLIYSSSRNFDFQSSGPYHVAAVDDGAMLHLDGDVILRLFGVETPFRGNQLAKQGAEFVRSRIEGRQVTVEFDRERRDREGRVLAYVYADGMLVNEELIRSGWARLESNSGIDRSMATRFRHAEEEARGAGRGIWSVAAVSAR